MWKRREALFNRLPKRAKNNDDKQGHQSREKLEKYLGNKYKGVMLDPNYTIEEETNQREDIVLPRDLDTEVIAIRDQPTPQQSLLNCFQQAQRCQFVSFLQTLPQDPQYQMAITLFTVSYFRHRQNC